MAGSSCVLLSFLCISLGSVPACAASGSLHQHDVYPCNSSTAEVSVDQSYVFALKGGNLSLCPNASFNLSGIGAFRIHTYTNARADESTPVVFTARQDTDVISWTSPLEPQGFKTSFTMVNRTLCSLQFPVNSSDPPILYLDIFSNAEEPIPFTVNFVPVASYSLSTHTRYPILVGASTPQIHYFKFPKHTDTVTVQATTRSKICAIVSVQNNSCPANDLLKNALYKGLYQTMSTNAFLTVKSKHVNDHEFLLVMITTNYSVCHHSQPHHANESDLYEQVIEVQIKPLASYSKYIVPMLLPVGIFLAIYVIALLQACLSLILPTFTWARPCTWEKLKPSPPITTLTTEDQPGEEAPLVSKTTNSSPSVVRQRNYGATGDGTTQTGGSLACVCGDGQLRAENDAHQLDDDDSVELSVRYSPEADLKVHRLCRTPLKRLEKEYSVYSWNTITVGIFYGLPAFQLVLAEQLLVDSSGNQDQCYYNFNCAHPLGVLSAFNNVWSNIGYVMLGVLFLIIVFMREMKFKQDRRRNKAYVDSRGVPQMFGIYYAMGVALVVEGFMSGFYHICPNGANFQFDTAFMFIIGGLLIVKVFQARHPDINANAFIAFFSFAVVIFFTLLGIYLDHANPLAVRLVLLLVGLILIIGFFISFYHFHDWRVGLKTAKGIFNTITFYFTHSPKKWTPTHKIRFLKLTVAVILNICLAVIDIAGFHLLDIPTAVLVFFLANLMYFILWYLVQKLWYREQWTILPAVAMVFIGGFWAAALYFYFSSVTDWELTPAESRDLNKDCILLNFYDSHDVWHFLSACAMFSSFMLVLTLDDGLAHTQRCQINIF